MNADKGTVAPRIVGHAAQDEAEEEIGTFDAAWAAVEIAHTVVRVRAVVWAMLTLAAWGSFFVAGWLYALGRVLDWKTMLGWTILGVFFLLSAPKGTGQ